MFSGFVLGKEYLTWSGFKIAYNEAVDSGLLKDKNGRLVTKKL